MRIRKQSLTISDAPSVSPKHTTDAFNPVSKNTPSFRSAIHTVRRNPLRAMTIVAAAAGTAGYLKGRQTAYDHSMRTCGEEGYHLYVQQVGQQASRHEEQIAQLESDHAASNHLCTDLLNYASSVNQQLLDVINEDRSACNASPVNIPPFDPVSNLQKRGMRQDHAGAQPSHAHSASPVPRATEAPQPNKMATIVRRGEGHHGHQGVHHHASPRPSATHKPKQHG